MNHPKRSVNVYNSILRAINNKWIVVLSSDGYANYGTGNILNSDNAAPNGFANSNAWCVLSKTINGQQYQFCIQTDGYMGFRIKYSKSGFNNGLGNLDNTAGATDQQILLGGGTDTSPTYQQILNGSIQFEINKVNISVTTSTNILNFKLSPAVPPVATHITTIPKPVINTVLK